MQINAPINISSMVNALDLVKGVQSIINFKFYCKTGGNYSNNKYGVDAAIKNNILYPSLDPSIFEIKYPDNDIKARIIKP